MDQSVHRQISASQRIPSLHYDNVFMHNTGVSIKIFLLTILFQNFGSLNMVMVRNAINYVIEHKVWITEFYRQ